MFAYDIDIKSAYPSATIALNVSKTTQLIEVCLMDNTSEFDRRRVGINLTALIVNAIGIAKEVYGVKDFPDYVDEFMEYCGKQ